MASGKNNFPFSGIFLPRSALRKTTGISDSKRISEARTRTKISPENGKFFLLLALVSPDGNRGVNPRLRFLFGGLCCLIVSVPFLVVDFPPISDLPQQASQIRLLGEVMDDPGGMYRIQWITPYSTSYLILGLSWILFGPACAGRIAMLLITLLLVGAIHFTAARRRRPAASAVLATVLVFNLNLYWGFFSFCLGMAGFLVWLLLLDRDRSSVFRRRDYCVFMAVAVAMYFTHALWFGVAAVCLAVFALVFLHPGGVFFRRAFCFLLLLVPASFWFRQVLASGFASAARYSTSPLERLAPSALVDAALGGLKGPLEVLFLVGVVGWILLGLWQSRNDMKARLDLELLTAAVLMVLLYLVLPDRYGFTILFARRWLPMAVILLLLAMPLPRIRAGVALAVLVLFTGITASGWIRFEGEELEGLEAALEALPEDQRVIGLAFDRESAIVKGEPFIQTFAYAQLLRGGRLNITFAEIPSALVVFKAWTQPPWTRSLNWYPERYVNSDFLHFDHALIQGTEAKQRRFAALPCLEPATHAGRWRLYRVVSGWEP